MNKFSSTPTYSIQQLSKSERPRERLLQYGAEALTTAELIAILLGSGMKGLPVLQLAQMLVNRFGDVQHLSDATITELCEIRGLGPAKALQLKAAFNLGARATRVASSAKYRIENPLHAYHLIKDELEREQRELFVVILQNSKGFVICHQVVAVGTLSHALVHPREVFNPAIRHSAASMIVAHNHPSGDPTPSKQDFELTESLVKVGQLVGIPVNDHLIIGEGRYISLRQLSSTCFT